MTDLERIGQRLVTGFPGTALTPELVQVVKEYKIGNIILFRENIASADQLRTLCADLQTLIRSETGHDAFIMIDQEGGAVTRLPESCINVPGSMALAATGDPETTYLAGKLTGEELRSLGVNFNLAPSVDVNCNPANPIIGVRSYGDTPATVAKYAAGMIRGLQDGGVLCLAKHFPGHGDTSLDSHLTLPCVDKPRDELERMELAPFRAAIADGVPAIMTAHILFPALDDSGVPATMSRRIVTGLLRGEMSFTGLVTSDCMEMQAVQQFFGSVDGVLAAGVKPERIIIDPGLGFSKPGIEHNLPLLTGLETFRATGYPVLIGQSRKRFISAMLTEAGAAGADGPTMAQRDDVTAALSALSAEHGAWAVRVHDVAKSRAAVIAGNTWREYA